jgi:hypothetical protein
MTTDPRYATSQREPTQSDSGFPATAVQESSTRCPSVPTSVQILAQDGPLETPCRVWQGYVGNHGYAVRTRRRGLPLVHREAYELVHGPVPRNHIVHHLCENKLCLEVRHMVSMSRAEHVALHRRTFDYGDLACLYRETDLSRRELADHFGVSEGAVKAALERMRKRGEL